MAADSVGTRTAEAVGNGALAGGDGDDVGERQSVIDERATEALLIATEQLA